MAGKKLSPTKKQPEKQPETTKKTYEYDDAALAAVEKQLAEEDGLTLPDSEEEDKKKEEKSEKKSDKKKETSKEKDKKSEKSKEDDASKEAEEEVVTWDANVATKPASEMTDEELKTAQAALKKRETTIGTKTKQSSKSDTISIKDKDGKRLDDVGIGKTKEVASLGGKITGKGGGKVKYEGDLGTFEYDSSEWALGTKTVTDAASGVSTKIPILRYIDKDNSWTPGDQVYGNNITVPDGLKSLDYSFDGNKDLETVPKIPDSVETAHAAFKGCTKIERAAKNAKTGEHSSAGEVAAGVGTSIGGAVVAGAMAGSVVPGAGTLAGAVAGTAVGVGGAVASVGGAIFASKKAKEDGKGGTWEMPAGLKDATEMFSGCTNLTEAYGKAGENLQVTRGMYYDTEKLGTDETANKFGSEAVTDLTESNVSKTAAQGMYTGSNNDIMPDLEGNYSKYYDEDTDTLNRNAVSAETKKEVSEANQSLKEFDAVNGVESNDMTAQTDGLASSGTVKTKHGTKKTTDIKEQNEKSNESDDMGNLLDRGAVSLGEFWLLKKVTGNTLIAGVATFGLQAIGILPKSMKPVLNAVTGFVGKDSMVGKALTNISDKLGDDEASSKNKTKSEKHLSESDQKQDAKEKDKSDKTRSTVDERVKSDMSSVKTAASSKKILNIDKSMSANGKKIVDDGVLLTAANKGATDTEITDIQTMMNTSAAALEEKAQKMADSSDKLSKTDKTVLSEQCMAVMNGLDAYDNSAVSEIEKKYGVNTENSKKATEGLGKVMSSATLPFIDAIKDMDSKYDFLSDKDKKALSKMEITGVTKYDDYQVGDMAVENDKLSSASAEEDMSMYANAGIDDDLTSGKSKDDTSKSANAKTMSYAGSGKSLVESRTQTKSNDKSMSNADKIAKAEAKFGGISSENQTTNDLDYA